MQIEISYTRPRIYHKYFPTISSKLNTDKCENTYMRIQVQIQIGFTRCRIYHKYLPTISSKLNTGIGKNTMQIQIGRNRDEITKRDIITYMQIKIQIQVQI